MPDSPNPSPTQEVERYEVTADPKTGQPEMVPSPNPLGGGYVRFEDHQRLLQAEVEKREEVEAKLDAIRSGRPYPDCWGDCGVAGPGGSRGYCCDGAWDQRNRAEAAESKLSSVVEDVADALLGEEELYVLAETDGDSEGLLVHGSARDALKPILQLLRDKGTEQGGADGFDFRDPRTELEPWEDEHAKELAKELGIPVAIEGDPGLEEGQRFCVVYPDDHMCGEPAAETLVFCNPLTGGKGELDICAAHLDDFLNDHCLRPRAPTQRNQNNQPPQGEGES